MAVAEAIPNTTGGVVLLAHRGGCLQPEARDFGMARARYGLLPRASLTRGEYRKTGDGTHFMQIELFGPGSGSLLGYLRNAQIAVDLSRTPHFPTPDPGARFQPLPGIPPWREFLRLSSDAAALLGHATALLGWRASRTSRLIQVTTGQGALVELRDFSAEQAAAVLRDARKIVALDTRKPETAALAE